jgi:hypothetical protein
LVFELELDTMLPLVIEELLFLKFTDRCPRDGGRFLLDKFDEPFVKKYSAAEITYRNSAG